MKKYSVAVVGASGLVGSTLISLLEERQFPLKNLYLLASLQSVGKHIAWGGRAYALHDLASFDFTQTEIAFFCVNNELASFYAPKAAALGNIVLDKSSYFRIHPHVPLIIPEVNLLSLASFPQSRIIASPNCNTIPIAVGLKPLYDAVGITRINIATYQSVSGTGKEAVAELTEQSQQSLLKQPVQAKVYPQQIAFNVLPHIDTFQQNGYTTEEMKMVEELRKVFDHPHLPINPTAVRVPVYCGHSAAVHIETVEKMTAQQAQTLLAQAPGIRVITGSHPYPTPLNDAAGKNEVYIGRIREDIGSDRGLNLWIVADNLRKGAALNTIQIAEHLMTTIDLKDLSWDSAGFEKSFS